MVLIIYGTQCPRSFDQFYIVCYYIESINCERKEQYMLFDLFKAFDLIRVTNRIFCPERPLFYACATCPKLPYTLSTMVYPRYSRHLLDTGCPRSLAPYDTVW